MRYVDLSHLIMEGMPVFPGTEGPSLEQPCTMESHGFRETLLTLYSHTGTHMDAPAHMLVEGCYLNEMDVSRFIGKALLIDLRNHSNKDIDIKHLMPYQAHIQEVDFVVLQTGWSDYWGLSAYYNDFPTLTEEAARWLTGLSLKGIGVDAISVDPITSTTFRVHQVLLSEGLVIIENLNHLDKIGSNTFTLSVLPLHFMNADGSPVRALAMLD